MESNNISTNTVLDEMFNELATDDNLVVDGVTNEEKNLTQEDVLEYVKNIQTDSEYEGQILTERAINKLKRQAEEKEEYQKRVNDFLTWYYNYQQAQYFEKHRYAMSGREKRTLRKKILRDWEKGKLKRLFESNLN